MNNKNIEAVVGELDRKILDLQSLRDRLVAFDGVETVPAALAPAFPAVPETTVSVVPKRKYTRRTGLPSLDIRSKPGPRGKKKPSPLPQVLVPHPAPLPPPPAGKVTPLTFAVGEKPRTLGGAMKAVIHHLTRHTKRFTRLQVRELLEADQDFSKLLTQVTPSAFSANLVYWSGNFSRKLRRTGDGDREVFEVLSPEWFLPKD